MTRSLTLAVRIVILSTLCSGCNRSHTTSPTPPEPADLDFPVGAFSFTERSGQPISDADLKGKVWVASFVFSRCADPCPRVMATMAQLQAQFPTRDDLRLVTFTIDPEYDTPEVLTKYAANFHADPQRWLFITGPEKEIHTLLVNRFKQAVERNTNTSASPGEKYFHSSRLAVVDKKGIVRAVFDGVVSKNRPDAQQHFDDNLIRLKKKVEQLLDE